MDVDGGGDVMEFNGMKGLDSQRLCLPVALVRFPQLAPWSWGTKQPLELILCANKTSTLLIFSGQNYMLITIAYRLVVT